MPALPCKIVSGVAASRLSAGGRRVRGGTGANIGTQLLTLKFSREDEIDADLVGLELAARAGFNPEASIRLWEKMGQVKNGNGGPAFLSTHPTGPDRIRRLQDNVPRVRGLYQQAVAKC